MIKTPLSTVIGGAFWTPGATILGSSSKTLTQIIKSIFSVGEQGFAYDPNDLTTLYQDAAGTIPVTAAGQPVGLMKDKSGRNNHAFQTVSASRPILQRNATTGAYYLAFDGVDDFLVTNSIDFAATDKVSLFAGVKHLNATTSMLVELSSNSSLTENIRAFYLTAPEDTTRFAFRARTKADTNQLVYSSLLEVGSKNIIRAVADLSVPISVFSTNGKLSSTNNFGVLGTGNFGNYPLYIGRRGGTSLPFNGHLYSLIGIGRLTTGSETIALEKAIAKNVGVTLNV